MIWCFTVRSLYCVYQRQFLKKICKNNLKKTMKKKMETRKYFSWKEWWKRTLGECNLLCRKRVHMSFRKSYVQVSTTHEKISFAYNWEHTKLIDCKYWVIRHASMRAFARLSEMRPRLRTRQIRYYLFYFCHRKLSDIYENNTISEVFIRLLFSLQYPLRLLDFKVFWDRSRHFGENCCAMIC